MKFSDLNLHPSVLKAIQQAKYETPTKIQLKAIPEIMKGVDIRGSAQTGSGKTAAFLLPALTKIASLKQAKRGIKVLVLVPTRELAVQVHQQARKYSKFLEKVKIASIVGGEPYKLQIKQLNNQPEIVIATPGRLIDLMDQKQINFSQLEILVLDEADRMLDIGFAKAIDTIVAKTPKTKQTLLFSATMHKGVMRISDQFLKSPIEIKDQDRSQENKNIEQQFHFADNLKHKNQLLDQVLDLEELQTAIIFTSTKKHANTLYYDLKDKGVLVGTLHGDMRQRQRERAMKKFREGKIHLLVATDIAARGLDIPSISHVVNFDLPRNIEDYAHRIGRTGRAGKKGTAISLVGRSEKFLLKKIQEFMSQSLETAQVQAVSTKREGSRRRDSRRGDFKRGDSRTRGDSKPMQRQKRYRKDAPKKRFAKKR